MPGTSLARVHLIAMSGLCMIHDYHNEPDHGGNSLVHSHGTTWGLEVCIVIIVVCKRHEGVQVYNVMDAL